MGDAFSVPFILSWFHITRILKDLWISESLKWDIKCKKSADRTNGKITRIKVQTYALSGCGNGTPGWLWRIHPAYIKENIDSLRLLAFIINFINLFNFFKFFKFYSRYPALNCRLIYKRQKETIQDSSYFQKETFLLPKTGESLPKKTS